jgi:very-short-patch-repair endonuclease
MMEKARKGKLSRMQKRNMLNDIFKNKIAESVGIKLIRLREYDINKNQDKVIFTIKEEISKQTGAAI